MDRPTVRNEMYDRANNNRYCVLAYRALRREETVAVIQNYRMQFGKKKPPKNQEITIETAYGLSGT